MAVKSVKVTINGVETTLTYNSSSGLYEGTATAPSKSSYSQTGHYYGATVVAEDDAGNKTTVDSTDATLGSKLKLVVKETVAPVITITSPTEGTKTKNNKPTISFKVTDNDSGVDSSTIKVKVDNKEITDTITKTAITGGYNCSVTLGTALADGSHTIAVNATDNDGNAATETTVNISVDTVPPSLSITSPNNNIVVNTKTITLSGTATDTASNPVTVKYTLNGGSAQSVTVGTGGAFSTSITLANGANTIVITATDSTGVESTVTRTVTLDTGAPTISSITITPNPATAGGVITIKVSVTD